jgi:SAM-dependent methyltransferase
MSTDYQDTNSALKYVDFLHSTNGQIQQEVLKKAIKQSLGNNHGLMILDAGCGPGWLTGELKNTFPNVSGCDSSDFFITFAKGLYPNVDFKVAGLEKPLPYPQNNFDVVILNMVGPDLKNLDGSLKNLSGIIKPDGKIIMTIPNPKYSYPAGKWERSLPDVLLWRKPKLKLKTPPRSGTLIERDFGDKRKINSYYYTLDSYLQAAAGAGLKLLSTDEIKPLNDSKNYDLNYQLSLYPLILLLEFTKF